MAFSRMGSVVARRAFFARRSNLPAAEGVASGWEELPALATTHNMGSVNHS
jgi:hypothetical protein